MNLYHYCPTEAFYKIITSKEIWLTSLSLSNDSMEGKLVRDVLTEIAEKDGLDAEHIDILQDILSRFTEGIDGLGFCLSEQNDLLSQWRGYANDACGVSIGFSKEYFQHLEVFCSTVIAIEKVIYNSGDHKTALKPIYDKIRQQISKGSFDSQIMNIEAFIELHLSILDKLFVLKKEAFHEEDEWRLIFLFHKMGADCSFQETFDKIKPYRALKLEDEGIKRIEEVVLGPKNTTPMHVMESFLEQNGFKDVKVIKSAASYR